MAITVEQQMEVFRKQLQAEVDAALSRYESQADARLQSQLLDIDTQKGRLERDYAAYEQQTTQRLLADIQSMAQSYRQDALARGMARSSYALDRNAEGEGSLRLAVTQALTRAADEKQAQAADLDKQGLLYRTQYQQELAAERNAQSNSLTAQLTQWQLNMLSEQAKAEAEAAARATRYSGGSSAGSQTPDKKTETVKTPSLNVEKLTRLFQREYADYPYLSTK
ncbi:MAG: hypothetical protein PHO66_04735 [Eubacteriales bacterium]|nr:hypothetical protein [Eubacteriales bacterium]